MGPGAGNSLGELRERLRGLRHGPLLPHQVDQGVRRLDAEGAHLAGADQDLPRERHARPDGLGGDLGDAGAVRPCVALAGQVLVGAREMRALGIESAYSLVDLVGEERAFADPAGALADLAARVARTWSRE